MRLKDRDGSAFGEGAENQGRGDARQGKDERDGKGEHLEVGLAKEGGDRLSR